MAAKRKRIDLLLAERGLFPSRSAARAAIMAGVVYVNGEKVDKPGAQVTGSEEIVVRELPRYVSRGGLKLERALRVFKIDLAGRTALDVGASTGGFTDCMLQHGAARVYSVDVGYGQLDWRLRQDRRVVVLERTNVRYLSAEDIGEEVSFAGVDVSFISLTLVLPVLRRLGVPEAVLLVKPQFEIGKGRVGKKGVVREPQDHLEVLRKVAAAARDLGYAVLNTTFSPLRGPEGNIEYLLHLKDRGEEGTDMQPDFAAVVREAHRQLAEKGNRPQTEN